LPKDNNEEEQFS